MLGCLTLWCGDVVDFTTVYVCHIITVYCYDILSMVLFTLGHGPHWHDIQKDSTSPEHQEHWCTLHEVNTVSVMGTFTCLIKKKTGVVIKFCQQHSFNSVCLYARTYTFSFNRVYFCRVIQHYKYLMLIKCLFSGIYA